MIRHHTRVVVINWFEDDLKTHVPTESPDEFYKALGRAVAFAMSGDREQDTTQLVSLNLNAGEMLGCYHNPLPAYEQWPDGTLKVLGSNSSKVDDLIEHLCTPNPFVMGVIKGDTGYSFHS